MSQISLRPMTGADWHDVAGLIYDSTNAWYVANGRSPIFTGPRDATLLFCSVYEQLDPGCCILAVDQSSGRVAGSCFYHPRSTHVSLGIMNVHPDFFGRGIARRMLRFITDFADERQLPVRLVSSAINLDSYSLYNRAGFLPRIVFQDMMLKVPAAGISDASVDTSHVRTATSDDIDAIVKLERQLNHIERERDVLHFIANEDNIWHTIVHETSGKIDGYLVSVCHPVSNLLGPGVARTASVINALILDQLNHHRGRQPVWLVPALEQAVIDKMYSWGARNCELHFAQCRGNWQAPDGIILPTFMPETG